MTHFRSDHHGQRELSARTTPRVFAHRGASKAMHENTIEAFETALRMGADGVELDVRMSGDGLVVVHHDHDLADGRVIADMTWRELPPWVPLLGPVLDVCGDMIVNIEIKNSANDPSHDPQRRAAHGVAATVIERGIAERVIVSSFSMSTIDTVRAIDTSIPTAYLSRIGQESIERAVAHGHSIVHPGRRTVDETYVQMAHERGLEINVWTVDEPAQMRELAAMGVDGIVTNVPDIALEVLRAR